LEENRFHKYSESRSMASELFDQCGKIVKSLVETKNESDLVFTIIKRLTVRRQVSPADGQQTLVHPTMLFPRWRIIRKPRMIVLWLVIHSDKTGRSIWRLLPETGEGD